MSGQMRHTTRGFRIFCPDFQDRNGTVINMVESSLALEGPHVRIYVGESACAHLDIDRATRLRDGLTMFIQEALEGELTEKP